jgi:PAS domain S-box-containing protein
MTAEDLYLNLLTRLTRLFLSERPTEATYSKAARMIAETFGFVCSAVEMYDEDAADMVLMGSYAITTTATGWESGRIPTSETLSGQVAVTNTPVCTGDARGLLKPRDTGLASMGIRALVCVPMRVEDRVIGVLSVGDSVLGRDAEAILPALQSLADHLALETDRTRAHEALRLSEARLRSILDTAPVGIGITRNRVLLEVNDSLCAMLSRSRDELVGRSARVLYPTDEDFAFVGHEKYRQVEATGRGSVETRMETSDGRALDVILSSTIIDRESTDPLVTFTVLDISERKRAELALRNEREMVFAILDCLPFIVQLFDDNYGMPFQNRRFRHLFGDPGERRCHDFFYHRDAPCDPCPIRKVLDGAGDTVEERIGPEGNLYRNYYSLLEHPGLEPLVLQASIDITNERELEKERLRAAKLESVGLLAGGIAHDFNNLLTGVLGNLNLARHEPDAEKRGEILRASEEAARRAVSLTKQLLTFSRGGEPVRTTIDLEPLLRETVRFCLRGTAVTVDFECRDLPALHADGGQLAQVFENLTLNAREAMSESGHLRITGETHRGPEGPVVHICFIDSGPGIRDEALEHLFDPYFTSKEAGRGLGLSVVHSIIAHHGGSIDVYSETGIGTTFSLHIPVSSAANEQPEESLDASFEDNGEPATAEPGPPAKAKPVMQAASLAEASSSTKKPAQARSLRVLVVDDEPAVSQTLIRMLRHLGHDAECCSSGPQAVEAYRREWSHGRPFDVVITDLTMPGGMSGQQTAQEILGLHPAARIVVSSGYSEDAVMANHKDFGFAAALHKPYTLAVLRTLLSSL